MHEHISQFPGKASLDAMLETYAVINGTDSFEKDRAWEADTWSVAMRVSRGRVLEKAGIGQVTMRGGQVEGIPADIQLLQTIAWPAHPCAPGLIIMASTSRMEDQPMMIMLYIDLISQHGILLPDVKEGLANALREVCMRHGQRLDELQSMLSGRGMLGACAAECGMLYFFEESDIPFLEDAVSGALAAYRIIIMRDWGSVGDAAASGMTAARRKILDWMLTEDYGVKVARQNEIPLEIMQLYAFPPGCSPSI